MKTLYLIRGVPGSGKSTLARRITEFFYEADQFRINEQGEYVYDANKTKEAHAWCQTQVEARMKEGYAEIAVANTFVRLWEMKWYARKAIKYGYALQVIECKGQFKNVHDVPDQKVREMLDKWECYHGIHQLIEDWMPPMDWRT